METDQLNAILRSKYAALDEVGVSAIAPADLAVATYKEIDPKSVSPGLVQLAAILELRQLARAVCRQRHIDNERETEEGNLFDFQLQPQYPSSRQIEAKTEVLRDHLTHKERLRNVARLRREGEAKIVHADALLAETEMLVRLGELKAEEEPQGTVN